MNKNSIKNIFTFLLLFSMIPYGNTQIGGKGVNSFLNTAPNARATAMGDIVIGISDYDVGLAFANPALLNDDMVGHINFSHQFHFADISSSHANYGWKLPWKDIKVHTGFQVLSYGDFTAADIYGVKQDQFSAKDVAVVIGASKNYNEKLSLGMNMYYFNSIYEAYSSSGIGWDIGAHYSIDGQNATFSAVIKNLHVQFSSFDEREYAQPDLQIAYTNRLKHLPLRYSVTAHNLQQWDIRYDDPNTQAETDILGNENEESALSQNVDNFFRHLIFSGEFLLGKSENFKLRFAYNHLRRRELSVGDYRSLAGFSGGLGLKIKGFRLDYGIAYYHLVGSSKQLTISTDLNRFFKKF